MASSLFLFSRFFLLDLTIQTTPSTFKLICLPWLHWQCSLYLTLSIPSVSFAGFLPKFPVSVASPVFSPVTSSAQKSSESIIRVLCLDSTNIGWHLISLLNSPLFLNCLFNISIAILPPEKSNEYSPLARYCVRYFIYTLLFNPLTNSIRQISLPQICRYENWESKEKFVSLQSINKSGFKPKCFSLVLPYSFWICNPIIYSHYLSNQTHDSPSPQNHFLLQLFIFLLMMPSIIVPFSHTGDFRVILNFFLFFSARSNQWSYLAQSFLFSPICHSLCRSFSATLI